MEREIRNPSDKCFITTDQDIVAAAAVTLLGNGQYFIHDSKGKQLPTFFAFGEDVDVTWKARFGVGLSDWLKGAENLMKVADCLKTFRYAGKRSSMNNIGAAAKSIEKTCRKAAAKSWPATNVQQAQARLGQAEQLDNGTPPALGPNGPQE